MWRFDQIYTKLLKLNADFLYAKLCLLTPTVCFLWQEGANADALSHDEYLNAPGEKVSSKFTTPGKYSYCEPPFQDSYILWTYNSAFLRLNIMRWP